MLRRALNTAQLVRLWFVRRKDRRHRQRLGIEDRDHAAELWGASVDPDGHLVLGGCDVVRLAEEWGTPLHVVDRGSLRRNYTSFLESFRSHYPHVEIDYSYKTNPLPQALRALHGFGAGAEVISHFELWLALELGVPPKRVTFNGPAKTDAALELAVSRGVRVINIDNVPEIDTIQRLAHRMDRVQQVGVRLVTAEGWSSQLGLGIRDGRAWEAFGRAKECPNVEPCGLHMHLGTGIRDTDVYLRAVREILEFANRLRDQLGIEIRFFDFGGGFGVPTVRSLTTMDLRLMANGYSPMALDPGAAPRLESYGRQIAELFLQYRPVKGKGDPVLIFEPGRAVTSNAQTLLLRVLSIKPAPNGDYNVILDGGKNVAIPPGFEYHEVLPASRLGAQRFASYNLFGPLCHPGDVLWLGKRMPRLEVGDVIAVMDAGAYFLPNEMNFSNPRSAAVMVEGGKAELIRSRESFEDIIRQDNLPTR